ncbi:inorganic diphosphatase [Candidatus Dojkabacteria bacterium]|nr:inorganic diphosphatase [Candidatus Dojkabacteria bacterium]
MHLIRDINPVAGDGTYRMIVETPKGVSNKYEVDEEYGIIGMDRTLDTPMPFPFEYGFIPGTWSDPDDDPVDVMALMTGATFPGCLLYIRVIGMYRLIDSGQQDNKILAVCAHDGAFADVKDVKDLSSQQLKKVEFFWENYKNLTPGKGTEGEGWSSSSVAKKHIEEAISNFKKKFVG